jgi:hypothetical protein
MFQYIWGTLDFKPTYGSTNSKPTYGGINFKPTIIAYTNTNYGSDLENQNSPNRCIVYLHGCLIIWRKKKQNSIVNSTTYVEYVACYMTVEEITWSSRMFHGLGHLQLQPIQLYSDSQSAIYLTLNPEFH